MKLQSLKNPPSTPEEKKRMEGKAMPVGPGDAKDEYPYWARMTISGKQLDRLPELMEMKPGDLVTITAVAKIRRVVHVEQDEKRPSDYNGDSVEIEFQQMGVTSDAEEQAGYRDGVEEDGEE